MMVNTTVYGWVTDGAVVCAACADLDRWSSGLSSILREDVKPLYYLDDDEASGLSCDDGSGYGCTGWIFAPAQEWCEDCQEAHWTEAERVAAHGEDDSE